MADGSKVPKLSKIGVSTFKDSNLDIPATTTSVVRCIRTRWPKAFCRWVGPAPVIDWNK